MIIFPAWIMPCLLLLVSSITIKQIKRLSVSDIQSLDLYTLPTLCVCAHMKEKHLLHEPPNCHFSVSEVTLQIAIIHTKECPEISNFLLIS